MGLPRRGAHRAGSMRRTNRTNPVGTLSLGVEQARDRVPLVVSSDDEAVAAKSERPGPAVLSPSLL
jgi:hypothetical protein